MTYTCIAVDDEAPALEKINRFIEKVPFLELKASFNNGLDAMAYLRKNKTDFLFLDIQMDDLTGVQLIELLDYRPVIIFTTAYEQYALKGYELDVCDYLLKPYSFDRFMKAVNKGIRLYEDRHSTVIRTEKATGNPAQGADFIFVKTEYRIQKVFTAKILYIEGMKDYLKIVMSDDSIMTLMNFSTLLTLLPEQNFIRVHKSFVVALDKIESIERDRIIINKERIPVGDTYRSAFFNIISGLGGVKKQG